MDKKPSFSVLIVDDDANFCSAIQKNLEGSGYICSSVRDPLVALNLLSSQSFNIILADLRMPKIDGLEFIQACKEKCPSSAIVLMTGFGNHQLALEAMRVGAYDYLPKPFEMVDLIFTLKKIEERESLRQENTELKTELQMRYSFANIIAKSDKMKNIFDTVKRLSSFSTTVLIVGESGTGKELLARAIHHNSPRRGKPFIAINCGAIPESLMESELFGHKKGSFTDATRDKKGLFEEASGGTIFLDEIGEMPLHLQVKLLRALQEQQIRRVGDEEAIDIDVRVVAATLRNLEQDVKQGRFRDDLYYRLNVVNIELPPLRERPEDISVLIEHFLKKIGKRLGIEVKEITPEAMKVLLDYRWRGNIRELENCIERAMVLTDSGKIDTESLPATLLEQSNEEKARRFVDKLDSDDLSIKKRTKALEIELILKALEQTSGNRTHAAKVLEISHRALLYKLKEYGIGKD
ncbi:MAG: sigma-54-dependent Fis family transcriptional regulator [Bdellovibrionales bacterium]|nr:sigma-54-dependent Fis family transcriptional regulator [Bdellovibrionales bacterium]